MLSPFAWAVCCWGEFLKWYFIMQLYFSHHFQNSSGAHPAFYPMGTRSSFPWGKVARAWRWPLTSIYCWGQYGFMWHGAQKNEGQLYLYLNYILMIWIMCTEKYESRQEISGSVSNVQLISTLFLIALHLECARIAN